MNGGSQKKWYLLTVEEVASVLSTNVRVGLFEETAKGRLLENGPNQFRQARRFGFLHKIISQFKSPLVFILLIAGVVTIFLERAVDASVIFIALAINVIIGLFQEGRASKAFEKLNKSQEKQAKVIRDGKIKVIPAKYLVPGDVVLLESGDYVPADLRLIEANSLSLNESSLTGESLPVDKQVKLLRGDLPMAELTNMAWMGTLVADGLGKGMVVATGGRTQIGEIAEGLIGEDKIRTPLQKNVSKIANFLLLVVAFVVVVIFGLGIWRGESITEMALVAIALAVSALPEGLPAAVTVVLAIGMENVLKKGGLVRSLLAAETLGSTTVILTDKTGTLTQARMSLVSLVTVGGVLETVKDENPTGDYEGLIKMAVLTSDAFIEEKEGEEVIKGRPLETAVLEGARSVGFDIKEILSESKRIDYIPFKSETRFELSLNKSASPAGGNTAVEGRGINTLQASGSPEKILEISSKVLRNGQIEVMDDETRTKFLNIQKERSARGERLIAISYKQVDWEDIPRKDGQIIESESQGFVFVGMLSFLDPLRVDIFDSIKEVKQAGAKIFMVTGDHPETALYIARQAGLADRSSKVISGEELSKMSDEEILEALKETTVFARVIPSQKLRLVNLLRGQGEIVAMTGDGVNDAPALKNADIGVAVESGTEVAKESSDMILLGNSFTIIVDAIREGRRIIDNLKKVIAHLLSTSFGEIFVISTAVGIGLPLPILPAQILWMNIIQEGLLNFAYAFEPSEPGVMKRNPGSVQSRNILTGKVKQLIFASGCVTGVLMVLMFMLMYFVFRLPIEEIRTLVFVGLSLDAIVFAISLKNMHLPLWKINPLSNKYLLVSLFVSILLLVATLTTPFLKNLLSIGNLSQIGILIIAVIAVFDVAIIELSKYFIMYRNK